MQLAHGIDPGPVGLWTFALDRLPWSQAREVLGEIEDQGWGAVWIPEAMNRNAFVNAALLLGASSRLVVATGVAPIHNRDAMATANGQRALCEAFPGRFLLGLGVSHAWLVEDLRGGTYGPPLAAMRAYLDRMDAAPYAAYQPVEWEGAPRLPRVLAALGPRMLALAAERADGVHPYWTTPEHTAMAREILGPDKLLAPDCKVVLHRDTDVARGIARFHLSNYVDQPNYRRSFLRQGFTDDDLADGCSDRLVDAFVAHGDVEAITRRVEEHRAAGADHVAVQVLHESFDTVPLADWRELAPALLG